jgi:hypothetical protein
MEGHPLDEVSTSRIAEDIFDWFRIAARLNSLLL